VLLRVMLIRVLVLRVLLFRALLLRGLLPRVLLIRVLLLSQGSVAVLGFCCCLRGLLLFQVLWDTLGSK
jgi:hypothetical protein